MKQVVAGSLMAVVAVTALPAIAQAARVDSTVYQMGADADATLHYTADAGEVNRPVFSFPTPSKSLVIVSDGSARLRAGSGCVSLSPSRVQCQTGQLPGLG